MYPKVTYTKNTISVQLNEVTKVTNTISAVNAEYKQLSDYIKSLYHEAQLPLPTSVASGSQPK